MTLKRWQEQTAEDGLILQDVFVAFPGGRYLAPDIAWWSAARRPPLSDGAVDSVPDVVVEVLSRAQPDVGSDEVLTLGETLHSALLDGFALDLARAFSFSQRPPGSA